MHVLLVIFILSHSVWGVTSGNESSQLQHLRTSDTKVLNGTDIGQYSPPGNPKSLVCNIDYNGHSIDCNGHYDVHNVDSTGCNLDSIECGINGSLSSSSLFCEGIQCKRFDLENCETVQYCGNTIFKTRDKLKAALVYSIDDQVRIDLFIKTLNDHLDVGHKPLANYPLISVHALTDENISDESLCKHIRPDSPEWVALDVSSPDSSRVDVLTRRPYGVVSTFYVARDGHKVTSIVDTGVTIYKVPTDHSCEHVVLLQRDDDDTPWLVAVYAMNGEGTRNSFYFERDEHANPSWESIDEEDFYSLFHKRALKNSILDSISINVKGNNDASKLYVTKTSTFPFIVYAPNVGYRINEVMDGSTIIWTAKYDGEGCTYASFYPREDPILAYLMVSSVHCTKELYYHRVGNEWVSALKNEYRLGLYTNGFNESTFDNTITLDLSSLEHEGVVTRTNELVGYAAWFRIPLPGYLITEVSDGSTVVWKGEKDEKCVYTNTSLKNRVPFLFYILVYSPTNKRVLYYVKDGNGWNEVSKEEYMAVLTDRHNPVYTHDVDHPRIIMSSFRNRQGLRLTSYASTVDKSRGDIILIHGIRGCFMFEFSAFNVEWDYEHYDFPTIPLASPLGGYKAPMRPNVVTRYRHLFEHACLDGMNALDVLPAYEYEGSFIEALNKLGYNVYGYDMQAHGLSEGIHTVKYHADCAKDHVNDLLQFISIVKRGAFNDSSEEWNEETVFASHPTDHKLMLIGNSLGANLCMQAVQEFYGHGDSQGNLQGASGVPFVDGLMGISPMLSLERHINSPKMKVNVRLLHVAATITPHSINKFETLPNFGISFEFFIRFSDPFFYANRLTFKTLSCLVAACPNVQKEDRMAYYPKNLPTLFIQTKEDNVCDIKGSREVREKIGESCKLAEIEGACHYLTVPQTVFGVAPHIVAWLSEHGQI